MPLINRPQLRIVVIAAAVAFCYLDVIAALVKQWAGSPFYSYGFAVPVISVYLVWTKWPELQSARIAPDYMFGGSLVLLGMAMLSLGRLGAVISLQGISLVVTIVGLVLVAGGRDVLRLVQFPIGFLILMLPIWEVLTVRIEEPSQRLSATVATFLLHSGGVPALQQGTSIVLSSATLDVMAECSGLNQLFALLTTTLPAGYLWLQTWVGRLTLVTLAVVLGFVSNGLRIAVLGWLTIRGVAVSDPHSAMHLAPGFLSVGVVYVVLGACLSLLARGESTRRGRVSPTTDPSQIDDKSSGSVHRRLWADFALLGVIILMGGAQFMPSAMDTAPRNELGTIPTQLSDWTLESTVKPGGSRFAGFDQNLMRTYPNPTGERRFVGVDEEFLRTYRNAAGGRLQLYVGYYRRQEDGKELTGEASSALQKAASPVSVVNGSATIAVSEIVERRDAGERGVVFWYDVNSRVLSNIYTAKMYTLWDILTRRRSNGAVVMLAWDSTSGGESSRQQALAFAEVLLPVLRSHFPS
jgi:EpsI family protein